MEELPPLGALRFEKVRERRDGEQQSPLDRRAVVAAGREVSAGSLLLPPALLPFEAALTEAALLERCSSTFLLPSDGDEEEGNQKRLLRCSRCKVARYASAAAQRRDWKCLGAGTSSTFAVGGVHSRECAALRAFAAEGEASGSSNKVPPASIRLAARVFWKQAALFEEEAGEEGGEEEEEEEGAEKKRKGKEKKNEEEASSPSLCWWSSPKAVAALRHHFSTFPVEKKVAIAAAAAAARKYMFGALTDDEKRRARADEEDEEEEQGEEEDYSSSSLPALTKLLLPKPRKLAELLATLACNAHALSDASQGTLSSYGVGLYPAAAMLNHSCWPSAAAVFRPRSRGAEAGEAGDDGGDGRRLEVRALRRLREGEEATISYVDLCCPRPERRKALLDGYSFDIDDDGGGDERSRGNEEVSPVVARWQGTVSFPPRSKYSSSSSRLYPVSATLHEARPRAAAEDIEEMRERRAPLESVCVGAKVAEGSGGIAWIEEQEGEVEEEDENGEEEERGKKGGRRQRRRAVKVLAWGRTAFAGSDDDVSSSALSFYATTSATAALAAALSSEALAAKENKRALSLAQAGREALLQAASAPGAAAAASPPLPCPSTSSSFVAARLDDALTHAAVSRGDFRCALEAARRAVPALHLPCTPRGHPPRAFALATLAKLEAAALGNGVDVEVGGGGHGVAIEDVRRAAEVAQQAAEEIGVCFPESEREIEFKMMAEGLRAEVEAVLRMR